MKNLTPTLLRILIVALTSAVSLVLLVNELVEVIDLVLFAALTFFVGFAAALVVSLIRGNK